MNLCLFILQRKTMGTRINRIKVNYKHEKCEYFVALFHSMAVVFIALFGKAHSS